MKVLVCFIVIFFSGFLISAERVKGLRITENLKLGLYLKLQSEYNTNITNNNKAISDLILHAIPSLKMQLKDPSKIINTSATLDSTNYTGQSDPNTKDLSDFFFKVKAGALLNRKGSVKYDIQADYKRSSTALDQNLSGLNTNDFLEGKVSTIIESSEQTLMLKFTVGGSLTSFDQIKINNSKTLKGMIYGKWKLLPKTAVFANSSLIYNVYEDDGNNDDKEGSMPLSVHFGILGQITSKLSLSMSAGYYNSLSHNSKQDAIGKFELIGRFSKNSTARVGYLRTYLPSRQYQYLGKDKVYLSADQKFLRKGVLGLKGSLSFDSYGNNIDIVTNSSPLRSEFDPNKSYSALARSEIVYKGSAYISYDILSWLGIKVNYEVVKNSGDYTTTYAPDDIITSVNYLTQKIFFNITADY